MRPLAPQARRERTADDEYAMEQGDQEDLRGSGAIFGLIGTSLTGDDTQLPSVRDGIGSSADDLIAALYGQYCRALDDPRASLAADWTTQSISQADYGTSPIHLTDYAHTPGSSFESIETFLTGAHKMEQAFGPMGTGEAPELVAMEPVPEILRLFAPAEYEASVLRRPSALPPALARREHHSLGIDSPLSVPRATTSNRDAS